jgi:CcmD family protein
MWKVGPLLALLAALSLHPATATAQAPDAAESTAVAGEAAIPAEPGPVAEGSGLPQRAAPPRTLRAHWHVFVAFALVWVLLFGYALSLGRRFRRLDDEVQRLHRAAS